jgi:hypothetical protein
MAAMHLVCVVVGAPGPVHAAAAGELSAMLPIKTSASAPDEKASDLTSSDI